MAGGYGASIQFEIGESQLSAADHDISWKWIIGRRQVFSEPCDLDVMGDRGSLRAVGAPIFRQMIDKPDFGIS